MRAHILFSLMLILSTAERVAATQEVTCYYKVKAGGPILKKSAVDSLKEFGGIVVLAEVLGLPDKNGKIKTFEYTVQQIHISSVKLNSVRDWLQYRSHANDIENMTEQFLRVGATNPEINFFGCKLVELLDN